MNEFRARVPTSYPYCFARVFALFSRDSRDPQNRRTIHRSGSSVAVLDRVLCTTWNRKNRDTISVVREFADSKHRLFDLSFRSLFLSLSLWIFDAEKKNARGRVSLIVNGCTFRSIKISLRVHVRCSFHGRRLDREIMYMYYFRGSFDSTFRLFAETLPSVIRASFLSTTFATLFSSRSLNLSTVRSQSFLSFFSPSRG